MNHASSLKPVEPTASPATPSMAAGFWVWGFGAILYLLGFFHRVAPAVITDELMRDFQINATALGNLSAFYFYSYVAMQIPTGILADRWGPRRLLSAGALIAAVGAVVFALAGNIAWAAVGRLLIGGSVAVAFVSLLKVAANWFANRYFSMVSGIALVVGIIGAVAAGTPLRLLVDLLGWRIVMLSSAVAAILVALGTWAAVRDYPHEKGFADFPGSAAAHPGKHPAGFLSNILRVFAYRNTALLFVVPGGMVGCVLTFSGLWGVPYLTTVQAMSPTRAAALSSALLVAWALGGPVFGWLSDRLGKRKPLYLLGCGIAFGGWGVVILNNHLPMPVLVAVLLMAGFATGGMIIGFAYAKESVPSHLSGTVSGVINMGVMVGPMVLQPAVGWVLDRMWTGEMAAGVRLYGPDAYRTGFSLMLGWLALSFILLLFTRETSCRQLG